MENDNKKNFVRPLAKGIGEAVFDRTYRRGNETWEDLAERVVRGNASVDPDTPNYEVEAGLELTKKGVCLWAGRHLQHGDEQQNTKALDLFSNCSTSGTSFIMFYLLLCGSGVGRLYDSDVIKTDWTKIPLLVPVLSPGHQDYEECKKYTIPKNTVPKGAMVWDVEDNRLGWAQIIENLECIAYLAHKDPEYRFEYSTVYIDFSKVRPKGTPIKGVQNKPAPGPKAFIETIVEIHDYVQATKNNPDPLWKQAMIIDDYIAQCVLAGGSRRSSRIACKSWDDEGIFDFIHIKAQGGLQTANNSVLATEEFWNGVESGEELASRVFNEICDNAYHQGTGEPAIINQHKLEENREGLEGLTADNIINKDIYNMTAVAKQLYTDLIEVAKNRRFIMIVNPCSEINLHFLCGYCILFDLAPFHCELGNSEEYKAARVAARSLVRANKMPALYQFEVNRTNRVGISLTGIFEYAYHHFGVSFLDLVNSDLHQPAQPNSREEKAKLFFNQLGHMRNSIIADMQYMKLKNPDFVIPHTLFTIKPSGSVSKLFNLTEGAHLPSMRHYLRWVAMTTEDPLVKEYEELGYPVKHLKSYKNTAVVGFPTAPRICEFVPPNHIVTAGEASPDQQYTWLQRIEKYWLGDQYGGQISYTLKFDPEEISYEKFKEDILTYHRDVKCCSWMFQSKTDIANMLTKYEYLPEEPIPYDRFSEIMVKVEANRNRKHSEVHEQVDLALLECQNGYCPL